MLSNNEESSELRVVRDFRRNRTRNICFHFQISTVTSCCVCIDEWSLCLLHNEFFHSYYYRFYFSIFSNIVLYNKKLIFNNDWTDVCSLMINLKVHKCTERA